MVWRRDEKEKVSVVVKFASHSSKQDNEYRDSCKMQHLSMQMADVWRVRSYLAFDVYSSEGVALGRFKDEASLS